MATQNNKNTKYPNRTSVISQKRKLDNEVTKNSIVGQFTNFLNFIKIKHLG